jgi:hypothetical protein
VAAALIIHPRILTLSSHHTVGKDMCIYSLQLQNRTLQLLYTKQNTPTPLHKTEHSNSSTQNRTLQLLYTKQNTSAPLHKTEHSNSSTQNRTFQLLYTKQNTPAPLHKTEHSNSSTQNSTLQLLYTKQNTPTPLHKNIFLKGIKVIFNIKISPLQQKL